VTAKLYIRKDPSTTTEPTYGTWTFSLVINGISYSATSWYGSVGQSYVNIASYTLNNIAHNSDGTKSITISASCTGPAGTTMSSYTASGSGTATLDTIPRYATCTQTNTGKTETTISMKWSSDSTISYVWYSVNGGSSWTQVTSNANAKSGTYTISSRTANTTYSVKTRVRRKDSGLDTDSAAISVTTYDWPYATKMPNFTIGDALTITVYNPLSRPYKVTMTGQNNSTQTTTSTYSGTSVTGFSNVTFRNFWYASIPSAQSGTYKVSIVTQDSTAHTETRTGGTYKINKADVIPSITSLTYADVNSTTVALTGNNQHIVQTLSTVRYTASGVVANGSASISSVKVDVNGATYTLSGSGGTYTGGNAAIDSGRNVQAKVTVTDSRGLTATRTVSITMRAWGNPTAIIDLYRKDNYYEETYLKVNASYYSVGNTNRVRIEYRYKLSTASASSYSNYVEIQNRVTNTFATGFLIDKAYTFQIRLTDLYGGNKIYTLTLSRGIPIIFFDALKTSVGVNCFPQNDETLEVEGLIKQNGFGIWGLCATLGANENLNNYEDYGIYPQPINANADVTKNYPVATAGFLMVMTTASGTVFQFYQTYNNSGLYARNRYQGTWSPWYRADGVGAARVANYTDDVSAVVSASSNQRVRLRVTDPRTGGGDYSLIASDTSLLLWDWDANQSVWSNNQTNLMHKLNKTIRDTTSSSNSYVSLGLSSSYGVLSVIDTSSTHICIPYWSVASNGWYARVLTTAMANANNTAVVLDVDYYAK